MGTSKFTWQALIGLAYAANQVDVGLLYRYLAFYGSGNQLVQTLRFSGPSLNVTFKF
jgi:opacity protein-like surface antigen